MPETGELRDPRPLSGQIALVTGAARGIGRATAIRLAELGAKVVVGARTAENGERVAAEIRKRGGLAISVVLDVCDEASVQSAVERATSVAGAIGILVNNAGAMLLKPFAETSVEEWDALMNVNLRGTFLCTRALVPQMLAAHSGTIVIIGSIWATRGGPSRAPYVSSKHAVLGFGRALAAELGPLGIRVCVVNPGPVDTDMTRDLATAEQRSKWLGPDDIARTIAYLCSEKGDALNGTVVDLFGRGAPASTS